MAQVRGQHPARKFAPCAGPEGHSGIGAGRLQCHHTGLRSNGEQRAACVAPTHGYTLAPTNRPHAYLPALALVPCRAVARRTPCWAMCPAPRSVAWCRVRWLSWRRVWHVTPGAASRCGGAAGCWGGQVGAAPARRPTQWGRWNARCLHSFRRVPYSGLQVMLSVIEIYNERIKDLLDPSKDNLQARGWGHGAGRWAGWASKARCTAATAQISGPGPCRGTVLWPSTLVPKVACPPPCGAQVIQDPVRGITVAEATELPVAGERDCVELMQLVGAERAGSGLCSVSHRTVCKHVLAAWTAQALPPPTPHARASPTVPCRPQR